MTTPDIQASQVTGIDLGRIREWMDAHAIGEGAIEQAERLTGGTQNILLRFRRGERLFVLRRPPEALRSSSNEAMRREARILAALKNSDVPHPDLIGVCDDPEVVGAVFYIMEAVEGFNPVMGLPALHAHNPAIRHAMGLALVDAAAALSRVDYHAAGLADFGHIDNYLDRQVGRWQNQLESYSTFPSWPGAKQLPGVEAIGTYLANHIPASFVPGVVHGDFSIANVLFRHDGSDLAAIVDWELCTIGDPMLDIAWLVATWHGTGGPDLSVLRVHPFDGFPSGDELATRYGQLTGRDMAALDWFVTLACFKLAILLEGTFARACDGKAPKELGYNLHDNAVRLLKRALYRLETR